MAGELPEGEEVCSPDALAARVRVHSGEQRRRHRPARRRARGARVLTRTAAAAAAAQAVDGLVGGVGELSSRSREVIISSSEIGCEIGEVVEGHLVRVRVRFRVGARVRARVRVQEIRAHPHRAVTPYP